MLYRTMKKTDDELSVLGFGCMRLPRKGMGIDEERAINQIRYAIDHGVNYVDTALMYPGSEQLLGRALADDYRKKVRLATKLPHMLVKSREDMDRMLNLQLKTLRTDHIDYYLIHSLTSGEGWGRMKGLGVAEFLDSAKADGRIVNAGFSSHSTVDDFKRIVDDYGWDFCQIQYNYLDETNQAGTEGLMYAASKGLGVVIMEPLRGGYLAKNPPAPVQAVWDEADVKRTPAEWALRWVWNHPEVTVVLSGMNDEQHIEENIRIAGEAHPNSLTEKELEIVGRAAEAYRETNRVGCTGCRYCMPCPAGVNIPGCFEAYNTDGGTLQSKVVYHLRVGGKMDGAKPAYASLCRNCGKCVKVCPQHLSIPQHLAEVAKEYETTGARLIGGVTVYALRLMRWNTMRKA
ncbi:aldo/keto reductase [Methanoculleus sp.]|uniref:aldo/keto reductase n=1 Tax=Methanoculleus sp. TaxID=90427 RepID=UPI001BD32166|nr:aldo/keto reductase [Methanoculleus sp.]